MSIVLLPAGRDADSTVQNTIARTASTRMNIPRDGVVVTAFGPGTIGSDVDGAALVISATDGPMGRTRDSLLAARDEGIGIGALVLIGAALIDDEELLDLVEMEGRELLSSAGFDGDNVPIVRAPGLDISADTLRSLILIVRRGLDSTRSELQNSGQDAPHSDGTWELFAEAVGGFRRAQALEEFALAGRLAATIEKNRFRSEVSIVVNRALSYWPRSAVLTWLRSNELHLDGSTPAESVVIRGPAAVLAAIEASSWGVFA